MNSEGFAFFHWVIATNSPEHISCHWNPAGWNCAGCRIDWRLINSECRQ